VESSRRTQEIEAGVVVEGVGMLVEEEVVVGVAADIPKICRLFFVL
jgi:hypothetical protein